MTVGLIWAQSTNGIIGREGQLPWHLPEDLARFRAVTSGATVLMGRATWESLPPRFRPLPGRRNVVLSRQQGYVAAGAEVYDSPGDALASADGDVWVIGGASVYEQTQRSATRLIVTEVDLQVDDGDTYAPRLLDDWRETACEPARGWHSSVTGLGYRFREYTRP